VQGQLEPLLHREYGQSIESHADFGVYARLYAHDQCMNVDYAKLAEARHSGFDLNQAMRKCKHLVNINRTMKAALRQHLGLEGVFNWYLRRHLQCGVNLRGSFGA